LSVGEEDFVANGFDIQRAFERVHERLSVISDAQIEARTHLKNLLGNGQPGRVTLIEADVENLRKDLTEEQTARKEIRSYIKGAMAIFLLLGFAGHLVVDYVLPLVGLVHK